jgi:hypothetical protein
MKIGLNFSLIAALSLAALNTAVLAQTGLSKPTLGSSAVNPAPAPRLGVDTTFRPAPSLTPSPRPSLPATPAPVTSPPPSFKVPGTGGYAVVGPQPPVGNPGKQITVTPGKIDIPVGSHQPPQSAYGVTVTAPVGTLQPKK